MWRHYPWLVGALAAPIVFGAVGPEGQAVTGWLLGLGLLLLAGELRGPSRRGEWLIVCLGALILFLPLIPLPAGLVQWLSPQRFRLAQDFPMEPGLVPAWMPLTISPAGTMQRLWELALLIVAFRLARHGATVPGMAGRLVFVVGLGLVLLAASDVWYRMDGQRALLGIKPTLWGKGAGTFANRNHFADWLYVGGLFCAGGILRVWWPLRGARTSEAGAPNASSGLGLMVAVAVAFGAVMAVLSGSRGGVIALAAGLLVWVGLLGRRSHDRGRFVLLGLVGLSVVAVLILAGESLFARLSDVKMDLGGRYPKLAIWQESLRMALLFPWFGTGWGSFVTAFNHFKSFGGDSTFWHAENDYVQLFAETGVFGVLVAGFFLFRWLRRPLALAWNGRIAEPELVFGALAALVAFACHAGIEFVFQISGTAVLAAILLGWLAGHCDQSERTAVLPPISTPRWGFNVLCAICVMGMATLQGLGWWHWRDSFRASSSIDAGAAISQSLKYWPLASIRRVALVRTQVRSVGAESLDRQRALVTDFRRQLSGALVLDPFNWELRLERAWLDAAFSTNRAGVRAEVLEVVALNPLQPAVPLRFAPFLVNQDPDLAAELLRRSRPVTPADLRTAYSVSLRLFARPALLWELTPDTVAGLQTLADFALQQRLFPMVAEACERLRGRVDPMTLADLLLRAERPGQALAMVPSPPAKTAEKMMLAVANERLGRSVEAVKYAEMVWLESARASEISAPAKSTRNLDGMLADWQSGPRSAPLARELAEQMFQLAPAGRDLRLLRELAAQYPSELRLLWLVFRTEKDRGFAPEAARSAVALANLAVRR